MSTTTTPASEQHLAFLEMIISERFDEVPSRDRLPSEKRAVSAMIDQLRASRPPLPATEEQLDELKSLADQAGISIVARDDRAGVNRQLHELRRRVNSVVWQAAKQQADAEIEALFGSA